MGGVVVELKYICTTTLNILLHAFMLLFVFRWFSGDSNEAVVGMFATAYAGISVVRAWLCLIDAKQVTIRRNKAFKRAVNGKSSEDDRE